MSDILDQQGVDLPLQKLTFDEYAVLSQKNMNMIYPMKWYDNGNNPLRTLTMWPIPTKRYVIVLWLWQPLDIITNLDVDLVFPKGYERALKYCLAVELAAEFGKQVPPNVARIAAHSKAMIKRLNSKPQMMVGDYSIASDEQALFNYQTGDTIPSNM